jgi:hypothetical protein
MERRDVVGGGLLGLTALLGTAAPAAAAGAAQRSGDAQVVADAIEEFAETIERALLPPFAELAEIRTQQHTFIKAAQKFPDFIDVGLNVWDRVYDWHIRHRFVPQVVRRQDGRYTMPVMLTTLVLRPEQQDNYVGFGYDDR